MSDAIQIPKHYADTFKSIVFHKAQQANSVLASGVRNETHDYGAETVFYDSYEKTNVNKRITRNADTNLVEVNRDRRAVRADIYDWATLVDKMDKVKQIHQPESPLQKAATMAFMRNKDQVIYEAGLGTAYTGQKGLDAVVLPTTQKMVAHDGTATAQSALNIATLADLKVKFWANDVGTGADMVQSPIFHIACKGTQIGQMLKDPTITSADYAAIKALVNGEIDTFMGFKFHIYNGVSQITPNVTFNINDGSIGAGTGTTSGAVDRCLVWYEDGILLSTGDDMKVDIGPRRDKSVVTQIYADMRLGAVRMEEVKVIELYARSV
jgi:hypothetical protein